MPMPSYAAVGRSVVPQPKGMEIPDPNRRMLCGWSLNKEDEGGIITGIGSCRGQPTAANQVEALGKVDASLHNKNRHKAREMVL